MTIALDHLQEGDWAALNRIIDVLRRLVIETGGVSLGVRIGAATLTWPGGTKRSTNLSITHGLGKLPIIAFAEPMGGISSGAFAITTSFSPGVTSFSATAVTDDGSSPAAASTCAIGWLAIG